MLRTARVSQQETVKSVVVSLCNSAAARNEDVEFVLKYKDAHDIYSEKKNNVSNKANV